MKKVHERIVEIRKALGMSGNQLAKTSGIAQSTISAIESGKTSPTIDSLERICAAFGITLSDFFSEEDEQFPPDLLQLMETVKNLTPQQRIKLNQFIEDMLMNPPIISGASMKGRLRHYVSKSQDKGSEKISE
ncbi:MAG: helix-turn-helix domain-containing protein [Alicyclobacillus sp.]|nr:helix-turn-helix domain-containing protein [Alicyclobacillus sp.]